MRRGYFGFARTAGGIGELDGLRAIAVLLVLGRHAVWPLYQETGALFAIGPWDVAVPFINGWIGVDLFFVLSGFLITHHILRRGDGRPLANLGFYMAGRALRIVPTYVAVLALVVAGSIPLYQVAPEGLWVRVAYHLLFLQDYLPANIVVAFWSLGVEEKFYLVAPFVVFAVLARRGWGRAALLAGLILLPTVLRAVTAVQHPDIGDYNTFFFTFRSPFHLSFDGLMIGVACAFLYRGRVALDAVLGARWAVAVWWSAVLALTAQLFGGELLGAIGWYEKMLQPLVLSLTFGGMLLAAACGGARGLAARALRSWLALIVARISYPLYLIHIPLVPLALVLSGFGAGGGSVDFVGYLAVFGALSVVAALALHFGVEKPFLMVKSQMVSRPAGEMRAA